MKKNYQLELDNLLETIDVNNPPTLFLHACCGPCSSYVLEYLSKYFKITIFYYNPNIDSSDEFEKRIREVEKLINEMDLVNPVNVIIGNYDNNLFEQIVKGYEEDQEGGPRCFKCYRMRLLETVIEAKKRNFDYFGTTLSISPYKNADKLNEIGIELENEYNVKYLRSDFKKKNGYKRSIELSTKYNLYRQDYCGCKYSKKQRDLKKLNQI